MSDCKTCRHYHARHDECGKLLGLLQCFRCRKLQPVGNGWCPECGEPLSREVIWECGNGKPPKHCPGHEPKPEERPTETQGSLF